MFSGKIYTADKNFTRPPVATVATNFKSASAIRKHGTGENMLHGRIGTVGPGSLKILFWKAWEQRFTACSLGIERRLAVEKLVRKLIRCDQCRMQSNIVAIVTRMSMA